MIAGLLLAAGRGRRFGGAKLLARLPDGRPIARAALEALAPAVDCVYAVVRPDDATLTALLATAGARVLPCPTADAGLGASLAWGVGQTAHAAGWLILPADMPWLTPATTQAVAAKLATQGGIVAPCYRGRRGHPVGFDRRFLAELASLSGDLGARGIIERHRACLRLIDTDDAGVVRDVDQPADLLAAPGGV